VTLPVPQPALCPQTTRGTNLVRLRPVRMLKRPYTSVLGWSTTFPKTTVLIAVIAFAGAISLFPFLGTSFIPEMKEGVISPNMDRVPNIALDESIEMEKKALQAIGKLPGVEYVVSRLGRGESPVDPAGYNESDMMIQLKPLEERKDLSQEAIENEVRKIVTSFPGVNPVMAQPISDRVDEMVTGVRADVAVKIFGDEIDDLIKAANEVAKVAGGIRGTGDIKIDRMMGQQSTG